MTNPYIIAEVAQGYEGRVDTGRLLIKGAKAAGADAVKFQIIYADDVCVPGYVHYDLFKGLEMPNDDWQTLRNYARDLGIAFYGDAAGPRSLELADKLSMDGTKIHATCFFEDELFDHVLKTDMNVLLSIGGIEFEELSARIAQYDMAGNDKVTIMHGFQAEPTPTERNNLSRIPELRDQTGLDIGFMDHADGAGPDTVTLSAMALALGVRVFEKHITLDRALELEDFVSGLAPDEFANYVADLHRLATGLGVPDIFLLDEERDYRSKALKRVVARRTLPNGHLLSDDDLVLLRPKTISGLFDPAAARGRTLTRALEAGDPIEDADLK